ncbi:MAG: AAA family ATPase, partial [Blastocatellia bacterium]
MKIKQLDIKGFRSLKDVSWQPGDLNVVIGQNGTGKSNLLRALELISASAQGRLSKYIQAASGMGPILWDGISSSVNIDLKMYPPGTNYEFELVQLGKTSHYVVQREILASNEAGKGDLGTRVIKQIERTNLQLDYLEELLGSLGYVPQEETLLSFPFIPGISNPVTQRVRNQLNKITIYHDLNVGQDSKIRQAPVARFEKQVEPDGQNLAQVLHTLYTGDREFERNIDAAMRAAFGPDYEKLLFPPDADQRIQLRVRWRTLQREQSAADLSDGTLRFLLLLTVLTAPDPPMLIAIDEPETGLHPAMYPIIAEFAIEAASRTQLVFTTHSPQFLDAFTENKPTTTVATWENGETSLHTLE